jgi:7-cyano-7-deazaguanine synthase in queuosine biosynthesis
MIRPHHNLLLIKKTRGMIIGIAENDSMGYPDFSPILWDKIAILVSIGV